MDIKLLTEIIKQIARIDSKVDKFIEGDSIELSEVLLPYENGDDIVFQIDILLEMEKEIGEKFNFMGLT